MIWTVSKRALLVVLLLVLVVISLGVSAQKTFVAETVVPAEADRVWSVLIDSAGYPDWNPVFVRVNGSFREGGQVEHHVRDPDGGLLEMTATVKTFNPGVELRQTGGLPGVLTFDHRWLLEPVEGGTKVIQHEVDRGIGLWFWNSDWIVPAYERVNDALAERARGEPSVP